MDDTNSQPNPQQQLTFPLDPASVAIIKAALSAGAGVTSIIAGTNISISPAGGTGDVTVNALSSGITSVVAGAGISVSTSGGAATVTNTGVTSIIAGTGISVSGSTGAVTVTATGGGNSFVTATSTISDITLNGFTIATQNNDTVVTHGLGTTPKLITVSIADFQVPGSNNPGTGTQLQAILYITFDASGTNASGFSNYFVVAGSTGPLHAGGNATIWTNSGSQTSGTMQLELISIGATTFTFRIAYSLTNASAFPGAQGFAQGISWLALG